MGAFNTKYEKSEEANQKKFNINDFEINKLKDDHELFNNIIKISKELYTSYHLHFLNEDFCKKLSTIYKKKLFQLDITSLKNIHQQITNSSNSENSKKLEAVLSYEPSNQDTFIVNEFKTQLKEHLWNSEMDLNPKIFANKGIVLDDIPMTIVDPQNKLRYINISHVNELLANSLQNNTLPKKNNLKNTLPKNNNLNNSLPKNNNPEQVGGANNSRSSSLSSSSSLFERNQNNSNSGSISMSNFENINENNYSKSLPFNTKNKKLFKNHNVLQHENQNQSNINIINLKKKIQKANKEFGFNQNKNINENHKKNKKSEEEINQSNIKFSVNNNNLQQFLNQIPNKGFKENKKENKIEKIIPTKVQFQVRNYQAPSTFCANSEDCKMTKSQLCKAIIEHFIVRGNIIASILSTLPRKTDSGFEGGYCYQRFLNLDKCQVCLPHNYNELMSMDTKSRIRTMMLFINYMTEKECNENKGLFRKLSLGEKKSLILHGREGNDFNLLYTEYTNNVRVKYIQHLNILLEVLNTLATMEGINNEELNSLSLKTKETIDSMYHLCQFYYLYAIIALLNANIKPIKREESNEKNKIKSNMKQFLATV